MKIYMVYANISKYDYDKSMRFLLPPQHVYEYADGVYHGLYAWTTKKSIIKQFEEERNMSVFEIKKGNIDEDDFERFKLDMAELKLDDRLYSIPLTKGVEVVHFVTTKNEFVQVNDYGRENLYYIRPQVNEDYEIFNEELINALDIINYTAIYDLNYLAADDRFPDFEDRMELANYNASFNLTPLGNKYIEVENNTVVMLLYLFSSLFIKED